MKILAAADIHGAQHRMNIILENVREYKPDLVIIAGDITQFGPGDQAKTLLDQIPVETFAVSGNIDSNDVIKGIEDSKATNIEDKEIKKDDLRFIGVNGSKPGDYKKLNEKDIEQDTVIVSHVPPKGLQDEIYMGKLGGNDEFKEMVDTRSPQLVICGHIHEDPGYTEHGETVVVNCSMGKRGEGALIEIDEEISVEML
ncbi:MAG: metallophosphoesterase [Candidatus Thermoplasmatota archaeon]